MNQGWPIGTDTWVMDSNVELYAYPVYFVSILFHDGHYCLDLGCFTNYPDIRFILTGPVIVSTCRSYLWLE